jgi:hypothetical protein
LTCSFSTAININQKDGPPDDDVMAYSDMIAGGLSLNKVDKVMKKKVKKDKAKLDESTATVEYSLMLAGNNDNENTKFKK